jgi:hypothetical protein
MASFSRRQECPKSVLQRRTAGYQTTMTPKALRMLLDWWGGENGHDSSSGVPSGLRPQVVPSKVWEGVSPEEAVLIFEIGDASSLRQIRGHDPEHSRRLTHLADHRKKLEDALRRWTSR